MALHQLVFCFERRGGKRKGAGRKRTSTKPQMRHGAREAMKRSEPLHITLRLKDGVPSLRRGEEHRVVRAAFSAARDRNGVRLIHYALITNHIHLLIEAEDRDAVARGMNGLQVRLAKQLNKLWKTAGKLFPDRFHDEVIRSPKQARYALRYVLHNARHHGIALPSSIDPCSSGAAFDGWASPSIVARELETVVPARLWLLTTGWKRHGLIGLEEVPSSRSHATPRCKT